MASTKDGTGETVESFSKRWLAKRPAKTPKDNVSHLTHHILPIFGPVSILALASAHGDQLVAALDAKVAAGTMSDKHARNIWGTAKRMVKDAAHAKPATWLRCLGSNPFRDVMGPERTHAKKARQFLYPSEFLALVGCHDVPTSWRRNVAIAVFLGLGDGEQRALRWEHVDLVHGTVNVCEVYDRTSKAVREGTKTDAPRIVPIPAALVPLLSEMHERAGGSALHHVQAAGLVCRASPASAPWPAGSARGCARQAWIAPRSSRTRLSTCRSAGTTCVRRAGRGWPSRAALLTRSATCSGTGKRR